MAKDHLLPAVEEIPKYSPVMTSEGDDGNEGIGQYVGPPPALAGKQSCGVDAGIAYKPGD